MAREIKWLTAFAEQEAAKAKMKKEAGVKVAQQTIVNKSDYPTVEAGSVVDFENAKYKVVNINYVDELGDGIVLEKLAEGEEVDMGGEGDGGEMETTAAFEEELPEEGAEAPVDVAPVAVDAPVPGTKKVTDAPERARNEVVDSYDIEVRDSIEVPTFQEEAVATEQAIAAEDAVDRTTVENHYTWNQNRIIDQMVTDMTGLTAPAEEAPAEFAEEELPVDASEEAPAEEAPEAVEEEVAPEEEVPEEEVPEEVSEEEKKEKEAAKVGKKKITARNMRLLSLASKFSKAFEMEAEEILEHAELAIKQYIPARYQKAALTKLESLLETEGVEAAFDKTVSREDLRKTASTKVVAKDLHDTINKVAKAVEAEFEKALAETDEIANQVVAKYRPSLRLEVESKLKGIVEKKLASKGIYAKLERKASRKQK